MLLRRNRRVVTSLEIEYAPHIFHISCFPQFVLFALGLEQLSRLKVIGILMSMWGTAVWVVVAGGITDWAASNSDGPATAATAAAGGGGRAGGSSDGDQCGRGELGLGLELGLGREPDHLAGAFCVRFCPCFGVAFS